MYKARDLITNKIVALKKVRFDNLEPESVKFMAREILVLRKLDHPNVLKLEGLATSRMSCSLYLVFEYMEHDLAGLAARSGVKFTEPQVVEKVHYFSSMELYDCGLCCVLMFRFRNKLMPFCSFSLLDFYMGLMLLKDLPMICDWVPYYSSFQNLLQY